MRIIRIFLPNEPCLKYVSSLTTTIERRIVASPNNDRFLELDAIVNVIRELSNEYWRLVLTTPDVKIAE